MSHNQQNKNKLDNQTLLEFKVGPLFFCAPALEVEAIISPPAMISVPLSVDVIAGCFSYQGRTATVYSLHNKFGLPFTMQKKMTHIILSTVNDELIAFWVDLALDVSYLSNFQSVADYAPNDSKAYSDFLTRGNDIYLETSFQRLHDCKASNLQWLANFNSNKPSASSDTCNEVIETPKDINIGDTDKSETVTVEQLEPSTNVDSPGEHLGRPAADTLPVHSNQIDKSKPELSNSGNNTGSHHLTFNHAADGSRSNMPPRQKPVRTYSLNSENINNTQNNKKPFLPLIVVSLILILITFAGIKLLNMTDESARYTRHLAATDISKSSKNNKIAKPHSATTEKKPIQPKPVAIETTAIEAISTVDTPHIKESSAKNIEVDNKKLIRDKTSRIFELHINDQSAPVLQKVSEDDSDSNQQDATQQIKRFTHVVVKGDTLWHITQRYLDNPHRYPELAKASDINNPHRIYPGDIIRIIVTKASTE